MRLGGWLAIVAGMWATGMGATAASAADPNGFERDVLAEINRARTDPRGVANDLRRYRTAFAGRIAREDGDPVGVVTIEGRRAVDEAIEFLERQPVLPPLGLGPVLARAARGWADAQGRSGGIGHAGVGARVRAAGGDVYVGETISYGMTRPAAVVRQLIVDDGQPGRRHRDLVFARGMRFAGVGCGGHARYGTICVVDYAGTADGGPLLPQVAVAQVSRASAFSR